MKVMKMMVIITNLIKNKKTSYFAEQLKENVGKPKEIWKTLKSLGLEGKAKSSTNANISLKKADGELTSSPVDTANLFKHFYANLADGLLKLLPKPKNIFGAASVTKFYREKLQGKSFSLRSVEEDAVCKILSDLKVSKAPGFDNIASVFLRDGSTVLSKPITQLTNLSIKLSSFPGDAKTANIKPLFNEMSAS